MKTKLVALIIGFASVGFSTAEAARNVVLNNPEHRGVPFISISNADSLILQGNPDPNGNYYTVERGARDRAQSICTMKGYGRMISFTRGQVGYDDYVEMRRNRVYHVDYAYLRPFENQYGVGYPEGFSQVICQQR